MRVIDFYEYGVSIINPFALSFTLFMGLLMIILPRRYAIIPMLVATLFITEMQRIVILSLDFNMIRILTLFGWARVLMKKEIKFLCLNAIDKTIIWFAISSIIIYTLQWRTTGAFINRLGGAFNTIGMFFLFRALLRDFDDIFTAIISLGIITIPLTIAMLIEYKTGRNAFSIFGGVPEITAVREGRLRCQGAFAHPILAGTFGATLVPLMVGLWRKGGNVRLLVVASTISATIITITSASSGPIMSYIAGLIGLCMWLFRKRMRIIKFGMIGTIIALQLYMKAPVWALIWRASAIVGGSTGYHRSLLIDQFIRRFGEWFLLGTRTTAHWGWGLQDVTNQYVLVGIQGGIVTLILFIAVIFLCFRGIGKGIRMIENDKHKQFFSCSLGAALFAHAVSFIGVSYFDQIIVSWYLLLSIISTASSLLYAKTNQ